MPRETGAQALASGMDALILQSEERSAPGKFGFYALGLLKKIRSIFSKGLETPLVLQVVVPVRASHEGLAGLSAILKSAHLENPMLLGQLIETSGDENWETLKSKLKEAALFQDQSRIRFESRELSLLAWEEAVLPAVKTTPLYKEDGVYLITGGGGGLGKILAARIIEKTKTGTVILVGRSPSLEHPWFESHSRINYRQLDVSDRDAVIRLVHSITGQYGKLTGIIHAAGVVRDNYILKKTEAEVEAVLAPKVSGAVYLDEATSHLALDYFLLFSSMSGAVGNAGQSDYAAANGFLDIFAADRNQRVRQGMRSGRTLSVNWPLWKEGGMMVDPRAQERFRELSGLEPMESSVAFEILDRALDAPLDQVMVMQGEVERLCATFLGSQSLSCPDPSPAFFTEVNAVNALPAASLQRDENLLPRTASFLKRVLSSVLRLQPSKIESEATWDRYGIDSIMAMDLTTELEREFGSLPKTLFFEYPNLLVLAGYFVRVHQPILMQKLGLGAPPQGAVQAPAKSPVQHELPPPAMVQKIISTVPEPVARMPLVDDDIAIIGLSGRYPQASNIEEFWDNLKQGKDCVTEIPADRWDHSLYFDANPDQPGKTYSKWGGFLKGIADFDPLFFNISPREAAILDPQERLFLLSAYETLEDAGYTRESLGSARGGTAERKIGVYVGVMYEEYQFYGVQETMQGRPVALTGSPASIANRVSYYFDLHGPSMAVDTMCSSSLTAIHLACQSLIGGDCLMAIAGGVNLSVHPNKYLMLAQGKFVSSKGRCESFGEGAEGYVPGEGVGSVLLKTLHRAVADGDRIYGVIKGASINHGGRTHGYTVPNPNAQAEVISRAFEQAGIDPSTIGYIEAHGTGTSLGDPIEVAGLTKAFEKKTDKKQFCALGSVKSNIGHGESAAGIAGLTKVLLQMRHRQIAPSLHAGVLNPKIDFIRTPFRVQRELVDWVRPASHPRRAGISSFGAGGANAHLLIEEWNSDRKRPDRSGLKSPALIILSARNEERLKLVAGRLLDFLSKSEPDIEDVARTLQVGREPMEERLAFVAADLKELRQRLTAFIENDEAQDGLHRGNTKRHRESVASILLDDDMARTISAWFSRGKFDQILDLWTKGLNVDWETHDHGSRARRISLPTYPFAQERCWFDGGEAKAKSAGLAAAGVRGQKFFKKAWKPVPAGLGESSKRTVLILCTVETRELAWLVSRHFQSSRILESGRLNERSLAGLDWADCCGWIDLGGCGSEMLRSTDWVSFLQKCIETAPRNNLLILGVTCGLESWKNSSIRISGAERAGLYRMLQNEYQQLRSRHLDADPSLDLNELAKQIADEFSAPLVNEGEVCYRDGVRYSSFLDQAEKPSVAEKTDLFPEDRVLWITGGTRGLGSLCARHFVQKHGVRKIVLTGVENLPPREEWSGLREAKTPAGERIRTVEKLESMGAAVRALNVSLTDVEGLREAVQSIGRSMGRAGGVLHCAGLTNPENPAWIRKNREGIQRVLAPKIDGLKNLIEAVCAEDLEFFVLFSSVSAAVPSLAVGQADYAMANAFMDYMAEAQIHGLPLTSIQWPSWAESGAGKAGGAAYLKSGFLAHTDKEGLAMLDQILAGKVRGTILPAMVARENGAAEAPGGDGAAMKSPAIPSPILGPIPTRSPPGREVELVDKTRLWLRDIFSKELRIDPARLENDTPFADYGLDSVLLAQVLRTVNERVSGSLDPSILLEHSTIDTFAGWLVKNHGASLGSSSGGRDIGLTAGVAVAEKTKTVEPKIEGPTTAPVRPNAPARTSDVAVIGMSCRLPGAPDLESFWSLLSEGRSAIRAVPEQRWGFSNPYFAGLIDEVSFFDPGYFLISDEDARAMDPQAFLVLEEALKTIHHAGYLPGTFKKSATGVFIGGRARTVVDADALGKSRNPIRAAGPNYLASNISQFFDLRGPSLVLDTACSSALVGMNMAVQSLQAGEISSALVGGVSLLENEKGLELFQRRQILSRDGSFHVFDQRAGGVVLGEGVGMVLLKTLENAIRDGDRIYGVIKGIATNNDGRTAGPATPNIEAQKEVLKRALQISGHKPEDISHIEANGSGSEVTDLLELKAIRAIYRDSSDQPCSIGSMKPNIGHPVCAEGIASFIKTVLMLQKGRQVPFLSGQVPLVHFKDSPFVFARELISWNGSPRVAAVNCFADGGTNVHLVLESRENAASVRNPMPVPKLNRREMALKAEAEPAMLGKAGNSRTAHLDSELVSANEHGRAVIKGVIANRWRQKR